MSDTQTQRLLEAARARGLPRLAEAIADPDHRALVASTTAPDPLLSAPADAQPGKVLVQMVRRGLDPALTPTLLTWLDSRPLERGLVAWDILAGSLIPDEDAAHLGELRQAARPVGALVPAPGQRGIDSQRVDDSWLNPFVAPLEHTTIDELRERVRLHDLAAYEALRRRAPSEFAPLGSGAPVESLRSFARLLALARLPTLASLYLHYVWKKMGAAAALADLCEVLLEAPALERLPAEPFKDGGEAALGEYLALRSALATSQPDAAYAIIGAHYGDGGKPDPAKLPPRIALVYGEVTSAIGELAVPFQQLSAIANHEPMWRYAARVCLIVGATLAPADSRVPLVMLDEQLRSYGNDAAAWTQLLERGVVGAAWLAEAYQRLARETATLPHDGGAWTALQTALRPQPADDEVAARLAAQATL